MSEQAGKRYQYDEEISAICDNGVEMTTQVDVVQRLNADHRELSALRSENARLRNALSDIYFAVDDALRSR